MDPGVNVETSAIALFGFPPLSIKRNDSKSRMAAVYLARGYHFWVGITPYVLMIEHSLSIQMSKSKAEYALVFSKSLEQTPSPFSLRSVIYSPESEGFGSTRGPLSSNESSDGIRDGITSEIVIRLSMSLLTFSRNGVLHPTGPSPMSQAFFSNAFMPGEGIGSKNPSGHLGYLHFAVGAIE
jgi:hypothetical protein